MKNIVFSLTAAVLIFCGVCFAADFNEAKSRHFIVYYDKGVPEDFVDSVIEAAEEYYNDLTDKLAFVRYKYWMWDDRAKIYLYPDQDAYVKDTGQPSWSSGTASYNDKTIWTYPRESGFFDSLLPHEIGHIIFREVVGKNRVPLWLEEGVAQYLEQAKRIGSERTVIKAIENGTFIPFDELNSINGRTLRARSDVELFYAESINIVLFLLNKSSTKAFNEFLRKLKQGKSLEDALSFAYYDIRKISDLGKMWEDYLNSKLKNKKRVW